VTIPKRIHMLWLQGWHTAPELARVCADGWQTANPGHTVIRHDASSLPAYLGDFPVPVADLPPQAAADLFRAAILHREGGIWADASVVPVQPLAEWFGAAEAFGFCAPAGWHPDRIMENWFLAAAPGHPLLARFWDAAQAYWHPRPRTLADIVLSGTGTGRVPVRALPLRRRLGLLAPPATPSDYVRPDGPRRWRHVFPYFWFQYLFGYLAESDPAFRAQWQAAPKLDARGVQSAAWYLKAHPEAPLAEFLGLASDAPVQKLRFKRSLSATRQVDIARLLTGR
jgi:hypothetical protein